MERKAATLEYLRRINSRLAFIPACSQQAQGGRAPGKGLSAGYEIGATA
jgi:hypothetical protein